jgi:hypothetical protein
VASEVSVGDGDGRVSFFGPSLSRGVGVSSAADAIFGGSSVPSPPIASTANHTPVAKTAAIKNHGNAQPITDR